MKQHFELQKNGSKKLIIFSHGFGVKWDARTIFTDIATALPNFDFIFFDYCPSDEKGNTYMEAVSEQSKPFSKALEIAKDYDEVNIISHSFGAVVPFIINSDLIKSFIILAPPTDLGPERQIKKLYKKPGSVVNLEGYSSIPRKDGTTTYINHTFYDSLEGLNFIDLINQNHAKTITIVVANQDEIVSNDYSEGKLNSNIVLTGVDGDHNFRDSFRKGLVDAVVKLL